jgi:hypothetical protein
VELVLLAEVPGDRLRHLLAGVLAGPMGEDPAEAEGHGLGPATPDVDDHVHAPLQRVDAAADRTRDRLVECRHRADARLLRRLDERAVLQRGRTDGHTDHGADGHAAYPPSGPLQDRAQEQPGRLQVRDHTVLQRPDRDVPGRGTTEQVGGLLPDGEHPFPTATATAQQHDGRFVEQDAATDVADDRVGGAEIDTEFHRVSS